MTPIEIVLLLWSVVASAAAVGAGLLLWHTHQFHTVKDVEQDASAAWKDLVATLQASLRQTPGVVIATQEAPKAAPTTGPPAA